jgi:hypothetical protein
MSSVKYELGVYIPEDAVLHSHRRQKPKILRSSVHHNRLLAAPQLLSNLQLLTTEALQ